MALSSFMDLTLASAHRTSYHDRFKPTTWMELGFHDSATLLCALPHPFPIRLRRVTGWKLAVRYPLPAAAPLTRLECHRERGALSSVRVIGESHSAES